jgi:histidinol-phosphatase (PHP family)
MKLFSDYHMHPQGHRIQPYTLPLLQPWADGCRERGLTDFALTDHDRYHAGVDFAMIDRLREKNPDLSIRAGLELDNDPATGTAGRAWVEKNWDQLDFVLGSVHYLKGKTAMFDSADQASQFDERPLEAIYEDYVEQVIRMIQLGSIDCLSHLDLIKIHGRRPPGPLLPYFRPLLQLIKEKDLAMEINTAGWRKPVGEQYPSREILEAAVVLGIPLTLSSDAHSHVQTGERYDQLAQLLQELGVQEVATYHRHQRTLRPWPN